MPISNDQLMQMQARLKGEPVIGRKNASNTGKAFEAEIQLTLNEYARQGVLWGHKVDPPVKVINQGGKQRVIFLTNPWLDFSGVYTAGGGRALHFEAKSTSEARLAIGQWNGLTARQVEVMRRLLIVGAIVFLLWRIGRSRTMFVGASKLVTLVKAGKKSIGLLDCVDLENYSGLVLLPFASAFRTSLD